jgi:hydrogenase large subunit
MARLVIDPITRIGGHLRVEVEVSAGTVTDAWSSGTTFRGMESILRGRDPRDAWLLAQRVCGACTGVHAVASVRAVEDALGVGIPKNARLLRNILAGSQYLQDHIVHFYHLQALDWVDVVAATKADPAATSALARSISEWPESSTAYFASVRDRLAGFLASGRSGPFANGYWGHPAYTLPPETNLLVMAHYVKALDWQRRIVRLQTLLGGKSPHPQSFVVGGMVLAPAWGGPSGSGVGEHPQQVDRKAPTALSSRGLGDIGDLITEARTFVDQVYVPDALAIAGHYAEWSGIGTGIGNYLSYGEFPEDDSGDPVLLLPRGRVMDRNMARVEAVDQADVAESVAHSYYTYEGDQAAYLHPADGQTTPAYAGPPPPVTTLEGSDKYSWLKAPRYDEQAMEVGPLARILVAYVEGRGDVTLKVRETAQKLGIGQEAFFSTLGRLVARAIEAQVIGGRLAAWHDDLAANLATGDLAVADITSWEPEAWPADAAGWAIGEGARGSVGHWLTVKDGRIADYQIVDATTWNASPRDAAGRRGAIEEALVGTPVADPDRPVEILRTVHSFDPCAACAVHAYDPTGGRRPVDVGVIRGGRR